MHKLFKSFGYIDDGKSMNTQGIGLGLNISQRICNILGGAIKVESIYGEGTLFTFAIKLSKTKTLKTQKELQLHFVWKPKENRRHQVRYINELDKQNNGSNDDFSESNTDQEDLADNMQSVIDLQKIQTYMELPSAQMINKTVNKILIVDDQ